MVDVNTIVGDAVRNADGSVIILSHGLFWVRRVVIICSKTQDVGLIMVCHFLSGSGAKCLCNLWLLVVVGTNSFVARIIELFMID